jgi:hypothetical protein
MNMVMIEFPPEVRVYNTTSTDVTKDSIYNGWGVCRDDTYNDDWTDILSDEYDRKHIISSLKSQLNLIEQNEIDYLLTLDTSSIDTFLKENNLFSWYKMENEQNFDYLKLIAYYRYSILGKTDISNVFSNIDSNLYTDSALLSNT